MKLGIRSLAVAGLLMACSVSAQAASGYSYVEADFLQIKPDNAYTSSGTDLAVSLGVGDNAYFALGYQDVNVQPFGVIRGTTYGFNDTLAEFGGHTSGKQTDLIFGINYQSRTFPDQVFSFDPTATTTDSGIGPTLGIRFHPIERLDIDAIVRYTNFSSFGGMTDGQLGFVFRLTDHVGFTGSYLVDDKYTGFTLGLRWDF